MRRYVYPVAIVMLALTAGLLYRILGVGNSCVSNLSGGTGNWTTAGTWTSCGGVAPTATDTCTITAGDTVLINSATAVCGPTGISGTVLGQETALPAHVLTITADGNNGSNDILINAGGILRLRKNNRIAFDTNNGAGTDTGANVGIIDGGLLDAQGEVFETTIAAITAVDGDATCGTTGRKYTITPTAGIGNAQAKGRVAFMSGPGEARQLEIVSVAAGAFVVCTDYPDASSGSDTTGGQRLTPHAARSGSPVAPLGRHSVPILGGVAGCSANGVPYRCCTGVDAGTCSGSDPVVGDDIAIIQDVWFYVSAATDSPPKGFAIRADSNNPMPILRAVNMANAGISNQGGRAFLSTASTRNQVTPDFEFNNIHDTASAGDVHAILGGHDYKIRWNAVHDGRTGSGDVSGCITYGNAACAGGNCSFDNVEMSHNIVYRCWSDGLYVGYPVAALRGTNNRITKNIVFDGCGTGTGECQGIQVDLCDKCLVNNNVFYDITNGNNTGGQAIALGATNAGLDSASLDNWAVNMGVAPLAIIYGQQNNTNWFAATHNYVSNSVTAFGYRYGPFYSNVAKNLGLANGGLFVVGITAAVEAKGNFIMPQDVNDTAHYDAADCNGAGDIGCGAEGILITSSPDGNANQHKAVISDNLILGPFTSGIGGLRMIATDSGDVPNFSMDIDHNTFDARGSNLSGIDVLYPTSNPSTPFTINMRDNVGFNFNNSGPLFICNNQANVTDNEGNSYISTGVLTAEKVVAGQTNTCSSVGTQTKINSSSGFRDRAALTGELTPNYNWIAGSSALTAGASPAGSPIGVRALRFNCDRLTKPWSDQIKCDGSMPVPICNDARCNDSDGDGIVDLLDNCVYNFNPSQYDGDQDGKGNACDATP